MKTLLFELKESLFLSIGNNLPRLNLFNKYRFIFFKLAGVKFKGGSTFWSGFDLRPIGKATNLEIGNHVFINRNFRVGIPINSKVIIGDSCLIGANCSIETGYHNIKMNQNDRRKTFSKSVTIESNCWIGANVIILAGVTIGKNSVIGAGSIVTKDIPGNSVAVGAPAKVIRFIDE